MRGGVFEKIFDEIADFEIGLIAYRDRGAEPGAQVLGVGNQRCHE